MAERGFDGVGVGDIEAGAGLAPRSGALYKYFDSKLAVLEAGLEQHLSAIGDVEADVAGAPVTEVAAEVEAVARWLLAELDRERTITHVIEREGDRLPELRDRMRQRVSDRGYGSRRPYRAMAGTSPTRRWIRGPRRDPDRPIVNLRRSTWTFAAAPLGSTTSASSRRSRRSAPRSSTRRAVARHARPASGGSRGPSPMGRPALVEIGRRMGAGVFA